MKQAGPLGVDDFYRERGRLSGPKEFSDDLQAIERGPLPLGALSQYASLGHCCRQPPERPRRARHKLAEATTIVQRPRRATPRASREQRRCQLGRRARGRDCLFSCSRVAPPTAAAAKNGLCTRPCRNSCRALRGARTGLQSRRVRRRYWLRLLTEHRNYEHDADAPGCPVTLRSPVWDDAGSAGVSFD
jgi:hypothetical protein